MQETKTQDMFKQLTDTTIETMSVWTETNQRLLKELVELGAGTAREGLRLYSELSRSAIEAMKDGQAGALRRVEENAQAVTRVAERLQASTEQAGRNIQESLAGAASRLKDLYTANGGK